jgi:hypothetical protein
MTERARRSAAGVPLSCDSSRLARARSTRSSSRRVALGALGVAFTAPVLPAPPARVRLPPGNHPCSAPNSSARRVAISVTAEVTQSWRVASISSSRSAIGGDVGQPAAHREGACRVQLDQVSADLRRRWTDRVWFVGEPRLSHEDARARPVVKTQGGDHARTAQQRPHRHQAPRSGPRAGARLLPRQARARAGRGAHRWPALPMRADRVPSLQLGGGARRGHRPKWHSRSRTSRRPWPTCEPGV